ncbi:MAG: Snf7 family protein [Candidatus Aramenus sp.]|nr:Snf7 family protein [Candidatus Aramenus sp.]
MLGKNFQKYWAGSEEKDIWGGVKGVFKGRQPLKYRLVQAHYQLRSMISRLDAYIGRMQERDKILFERVVEAQMAKDTARAAMYANEVAEIRKISKQLLMTQIALEQVELRLETVSEIGDVFVNLVPVVGVINELRGVLKGVMPELSVELGALGEGLQEVVVEAGDFTGAYSYSSAPTAEARKILEEASAIAEQKMKEKFPDLPAATLTQKA